MSRVVFLIGGPGSGKAAIMKAVFEDTKFIEVNFDQASRIAPVGVEDHDFVVNGPAHKVAEVKALKEHLERIGYNCAMIFVNTTNGASRTRNASLEKPLQEEKREEIWLEGQKSFSQYRLMFRENLYSIDNSTDYLSASEEKKTFIAESLAALQADVLGTKSLDEMFTEHNFEGSDEVVDNYVAATPGQIRPKKVTNPHTGEPEETLKEAGFEKKLGFKVRIPDRKLPPEKEAPKPLIKGTKRVKGPDGFNYLVKEDLLDEKRKICRDKGTRYKTEDDAIERVFTLNYEQQGKAKWTHYKCENGDHWHLKAKKARGADDNKVWHHVDQAWRKMEALSGGDVDHSGLDTPKAFHTKLSKFHKVYVPSTAKQEEHHKLLGYHLGKIKGMMNEETIIETPLNATNLSFSRNWQLQCDGKSKTGYWKGNPCGSQATHEQEGNALCKNHLDLSKPSKELAKHERSGQGHPPKDVVKKWKHKLKLIGEPLPEAIDPVVAAKVAGIIGITATGVTAGLAHSKIVSAWAKRKALLKAKKPLKEGVKLGDRTYIFHKPIDDNVRGVLGKIVGRDGNKTKFKLLPTTKNEKKNIAHLEDPYEDGHIYSAYTREFELHDKTNEKHQALRKVALTENTNED